MSIERIKEKILENAKEDARRIYDKGKMESRALIYEARRIGEGEIRESKPKHPKTLSGSSPAGNPLRIWKRARCSWPRNRK